MTENQNLLGLGSLWDSELQNAVFDEKREIARNRRAQLHVRDALLELVIHGPLTVVSGGVTSPIHVERIGLGWLDGVLCGSSERAIVRFEALYRAGTTTTCGCRRLSPQLYEFVPYGAVLRDLERRAANILVIGDRGGVGGRVSGVWRDAITLTTDRGRVVVPWSACGLVLVADMTRL
jgi:hypothetical protein